MGLAVDIEDSPDALESGLTNEAVRGEHPEFAGLGAASHPSVLQAVRSAVVRGLGAAQKTLPPWLFYDERGSELFERITELPEYYLTRTERGILERNADTVLAEVGAPVSVAELGAGTAAKTGLVLAAAVRRQGRVVYQPIDVSASALQEACANLTRELPGVEVRPRVGNYVTDSIALERPEGATLLTLYIGSSIGNFSPVEARGILKGLRAQLQPGDALLLGTDLVPGPAKPVERLLRAYDDPAGVTAAFNRNVLTRLNRDLEMSFDEAAFAHEARWNERRSRIEMHLRAQRALDVVLPAEPGSDRERVFHFAAGETIHTENSHKFSQAGVAAMLEEAGFVVARTMTDDDGLFAVTLALAR